MALFEFVSLLKMSNLLKTFRTTKLFFFYKIMIMQSWMCSYHAFTMILFGILTPMIASAMALERYFGIRHGYFYMLHFNPYRARYFNFTFHP